METFRFPRGPDGGEPHALLARLRRFDLVLAAVDGASFRPSFAFLNALARGAFPPVAMLLRSPCDARGFDGVKNLLALYEPTPWMARAAVAVLLGGPALGRFPVGPLASASERPVP